jgi:hypothetical protein
VATSIANRRPLSGLSPTVAWIRLVSASKSAGHVGSYGASTTPSSFARSWWRHRSPRPSMDQSVGLGTSPTPRRRRQSTMMPTPIRSPVPASGTMLVMVKPTVPPPSFVGICTKPDAMSHPARLKDAGRASEPISASLTRRLIGTVLRVLVRVCSYSGAIPLRLPTSMGCLRRLRPISVSSSLPRQLAVSVETSSSL